MKKIIIPVLALIAFNTYAETTQNGTETPVAIEIKCHLQTTMRHSKQLCDLENGSDSILREKQFCTVVLSFPI